MNSELLAIDPFLVPDWRHRRVMEMVESRPVGRCLTRDDPWIRSYRSYLLSRRTSMYSAEHRWLRDNPDLVYAVRLFEAGSENYELPFILETRLVSGEKYDSIAHKMKTSVDTVRYYEKLFFNIRPYLNNTDWIFKNVLLPAADRCRGLRLIREAELSLRDAGSKHGPVPDIVSPFLDPSIRFFAYLGGPTVCDIMLTGFYGGRQKVGLEDVPKFLEKQFKLIIQSRSTQLARQVPLNKFNATEFLKIATAIQEMTIERDNGLSGGRATQDLQDQMRDMISIAALTVGADGLGSDDQNLVDSFDCGGVELDAAELVSSGDSSLNTAQLLEYSSVYERRAQERITDGNTK